MGLIQARWNLLGAYWMHSLGVLPVVMGEIGGEVSPAGAKWLIFDRMLR